MYFSCFSLLIDQISLFGCIYFETLGIMCIAIVCKPGCDVMNFEVNPILLIRPFFLHEQNIVTKPLISRE